MLTEDGELRSSTAPTVGDTDRLKIAFGADGDSVDVPALRTPGGSPVVFHKVAHGDSLQSTPELDIKAAYRYLT